MGRASQRGAGRASRAATCNTAPSSRTTFCFPCNTATRENAGLPVAGVAPIGVVVTVGMSGVEQFPPGEDAVESVWAMCLPTIVHGVTWTWSTGALSTVLVEIVQARWSPADFFAVGVAKRA
jgi:hypothetical protein